jgi:hypothetical protein
MVTDTSTMGDRAPGATPAQTGESAAASISEGLSKSASTLAAEAEGKVSGLLHGQIAAGADYVRMVTQTARSFADDLESRAPELARYMHSAAERADRVAEDLRHRSPDEMLSMASDYARRNPRIFVGGAIALGFVLSHFLKSGSEHASSDAGSGLSGETAPSGRREFNQGSDASAHGSMRSRQEASRQNSSWRDSSREESSNAR